MIDLKIKKEMKQEARDELMIQRRTELEEKRAAKERRKEAELQESRGVCSSTKSRSRTG